MRAVAIVLIALALVATVSAESLTEKEYQYLFSKWVKQHQKSYKVDDFFNRFSVFKQNLDTIRAHNSQNATYSLAMNHLGDLTAEEFKGLYLGYKPLVRSYIRSQNEESFESVPVSALPTAVDWRQKNAVTPVKNQQQCGSCWAFSTTGSVEGAWAIAKGQLVSLSEQQLVDCSASAGNSGCNGGLMDNAFEWIIQNKGLCTEASYPYQAQQGNCQTCTAVATLSSYKDVPTMNEAALQAAVAQQPVSIAIEADQASFQFYSGGVYNDSGCGTTLDHGVLAVGYGVDPAGGPYWIVKNSWGNTWGEAGYIRLSRGNNMCGISQEPSYPIV